MAPGGTPTPCFLAKSSDLPEKKTLRKDKEAKNGARVRKMLIAKKMTNLVSTVECARYELFAKSPDILENKGDGG
jgi:hypothetical protein